MLTKFLFFLKVFDMQITTQIVKTEEKQMKLKNGIENKSQDAMDEQCSMKIRAPWYHGPLSRTDAENLIFREGDFLVRDSTSHSGQVVLSSMSNGEHQHLLLYDPADGQVRNISGQVFTSVENFIEYYCLNELEVQFSNDCFLRLNMPVLSTYSLEV